MRRCMTTVWVVLGLIAVAGCAARRPALYPNEKLERVGWPVARRDIDACMQRARQFVANRPAAEVAGETAVGAGVGAAAGAAGGAVVGRPGRGAAIGAATGGAASFVRSLFRTREPSAVYKNFVDRCLREKGYSPIGWQ